MVCMWFVCGNFDVSPFFFLSFSFPPPPFFSNFSFFSGGGGGGGGHPDFVRREKNGMF